jgi:5-deoxy-glucuronate isomerase
MSSPAQTIEETLVYRKTHTRVGRHIFIERGKTAMRHLSYGRIILNSTHPSESFSTDERETGLICLSGHGTVAVGTEKADLAHYDAIYIPRDSSVTVKTDSSVDIAEFSAEVSTRYPVQVVRHSEIAKDPASKFSSGGPSCTRHLDMLLVKNIQAGRLIVGVTQSEPGNWTSWPPHEHAVMLEEMYVYFNMPHPAYGIQLVYNNTEYPEFVTVVRDGDAVLIPNGYHPNLSVPGHPICFLWAMAAHREGVDRQFGVFNVQPDFVPGSTATGSATKK